MTTLTTLAILFTAALLEAGGDALVRKGMHAPVVLRAGFLLAGAVVLFAYGYVVNTPPWDFGRLLGLYVVFFFVVAQIINWLAFGQVPTARLLLGGACIVAGGLIISGSQV
jgi:drug/metabolite transporter (DMT)-like permease